MINSGFRKVDVKDFSPTEKLSSFRRQSPSLLWPVMWAGSGGGAEGAAAWQV